jgi:predicted branched-subunit amino acid permease
MPFNSCALVRPVTEKVWVVSALGGAALTNSLPTAAPLTYAWAPSVAIELVVDTFHSTLTVTPVIVALVGTVASKPNVPHLWHLVGRWEPHA